MQKLIIKQRPRNNIHVQLYNKLKILLEKENRENWMKLVEELLNEYETINNFSYLYHIGKFDVIILDSEEKELIWLSIPQID